MHNTGDRPVYDVRIHWVNTDGYIQAGLEDELGTLGPQPKTAEERAVPDTVATRHFMPIVYFRDAAAAHLTESRVADEVFYQARHTHLIGYAAYVVRQPVFASSTPPQSPSMYEPVTAQTALNDCCTHLLTAIGLQIMYPERAAQLRAGQGTVRHVSPTAWQAILRRIV